jgi:hypothetical protein
MSTHQFVGLESQLPGNGELKNMDVKLWRLPPDLSNKGLFIPYTRAECPHILSLIRGPSRLSPGKSRRLCTSNLG